MEFMDILMDEAYRFAVVARDFFSEYDYEAGLEAFASSQYYVGLVLGLQGSVMFLEED